MKFLLNNAIIVDRHTEPKICDIPEGMPMPAKHEEVTITIRLISSGDTRGFTDDLLLAEIMRRLEIIVAIEGWPESEVKKLPIHNVSNCGRAISYDSLSDSFKKIIDSIEDNLNR